MLTPTEAKSRLSNFRDKPFRPHQSETIQWVMSGEKRFRIVKARTGFGKSLLAMVCGVMSGDLNYLVTSKYLQTQVTSDFPEVKSIWGRNNYTCQTDNSRTCDQCLATEQSPCGKPCLYKIAKKKALEAPYRTLNMQYFISEVLYAGRFSGKPFTVVDEADNLEKVLTSNIVLSFTERSLYRLGLVEGPSRKTVTSHDGLSSWMDFATEALNRSANVYKKIEREIESIGDDNSDDEYKLKKMREHKHFLQLNERCKLFLDNVDKNWKLEEIPRNGSRQGQLNFKPVWLTPELAEKFIWRHSNTWVLISATFPVLPVLCKQLGIDPDDIEDHEIHEVPSTFPPENSPVYLWPVANLTAKSMEAETPKIIEAVKTILSWYPNSRGLIHTVSYSLCDQIIKGVNSPRLVTHTSENRQDIINGYIDGFDKDDPDNAVLISPSAERGLDLRDDLCRFIIICKNPFLSLGDKIVSARLFGSGAVGKLWYQSDAMTTIEQQAGRGMRSATDHVDTYILDEQVNRLYTQKPSLWSKSFSNCISWDENKLLST
jgi:ATP-dependent DNA helicase DinG